MEQHLILYDGTCGFCLSITKFFSRIDKKGNFAFAPLQGKTARAFLSPQEWEALDTFFLIENFQESDAKKWMRGKGALRALWLVGGISRFLGWMYVLPSFIVDNVYRLISRSRRFFFGSCRLEDAPHLPRQLP